MTLMHNDAYGHRFKFPMGPSLGCVTCCPFVAGQWIHEACHWSWGKLIIDSCPHIGPHCTTPPPGIRHPHPGLALPQPLNSLVPVPTFLTSDIWWPSLETCSNLLIWEPSSSPGTDIWWLKHLWLVSRWYACYWNTFVLSMNVERQFVFLKYNVQITLFGVECGSSITTHSFLLSSENYVAYWFLQKPSGFIKYILMYTCV